MSKATFAQAAKDITLKVMEAIEKGQVNGSWKRPWRFIGGGMPVNAVTGKYYHGAYNTILLLINGGGKFAGYGQWSSIGAQVRPVKEVGHGITIYYPRLIQDSNYPKDPSKKVCIGFGTATVHPANHVTGYDDPDLKDLEGVEFNKDKEIEEFAAYLDVEIVHGGNKARHIPSLNRIELPHPEQFDSEAEYYATLFHELTHWTGTEKRLKRDKSRGYAYEELVAELGCTFLCVEWGLQQPENIDENHIRYVKGWLEGLRGDTKYIMDAAREADRAVKYLKGLRAEQLKGGQSRAAA